MGEWTTLSVKQSTVDHLKEAKPEDMSWNEFLYGLNENNEIAESAGKPQATPDLDEVIDKLERIEAMTQEATNAAQSAENAIEDLGP